MTDSAEETLIMKPVELVLTISGMVPDNIDVDSLFLILDLPTIKVCCSDQQGTVTTVQATLEEYFLEDVRDIE
jgi:magnesium-transporting ATPase (P-type)